MKAQFSQVHWGRVLLTGVLVDILILILNVVLSLLLLAFVNWGHVHVDPPLALHVFTWIAIFPAILVTGYGAVRSARRVESGAPLHGFLVGLAAALIFFLLDRVFSRGLTLLELVTTILMVAAGWLGGVLGSRGREQS